MSQIEMFEDGQDLPLFSGTAPRATLSQPDPHPREDQDLIFDCHLCFDTGAIKNGKGSVYCGCYAGQRLRNLETVLAGASEYLQENCEVSISQILYEKFSKWIQTQNIQYPDFWTAWQVYQEERL